MMMMFMPIPMARSESFFLPASDLSPQVSLDGHSEIVAPNAHSPSVPEPPAAAIALPSAECDVSVSLSKLAWVRSGDKGDICNVGVVARKADYLPYITASMSEDVVAKHYAFMLGELGEVERHYLPGSHSLNFLLKGALDGGCTVSLRFDPFGKSAAQDALDLQIAVPSSLLGSGASA